MIFNLYEQDSYRANHKLSAEIYEFLHDGDLEVWVRSEKKSYEYHLHIDFTLRATMNCYRCLDEVEIVCTDSINRIARTESTDGQQENILPIVNGNVDIEETVIEEIVLRLPTRVLCKEDCKGLCNVCGKNKNKQSCGCSQESVDPRLEVLKGYFEEV